MVVIVSKRDIKDKSLTLRNEQFGSKHQFSEKQLRNKKNLIFIRNVDDQVGHSDNLD